MNQTDRLLSSLALGLCFCVGILPSRLSGAIRVSLEPIAEGLTAPLAYVPLPDDRALVVDQVGFIRQIGKDGKMASDPVLDLSSKLSTVDFGKFDERGVLDLALHPKFSANRKILISYTAPLRPGGPIGFNSTLHISEFILPATEPLRINLHSERVLLAIDKPFHNHNGGRLAFGPDGFLYLSVGDGGDGNDQGRRPATGNGQNTDTLLGKILRIDINAPDGRGIPSDNPFADAKVGRPEIYAYGLRNPWGVSFDRGGDHALYAVDVGQNRYEELNLIVKGGNYGWSLREGLDGFSASSPNTPPTNVPTMGARGEALIDPIAIYKNINGFRNDPEAFGISVTGGYIYRGEALPDLKGHYVYGDWSKNWGLPQGSLLLAKRPEDGAKKWAIEKLVIASPEKWSGYVVAFGQGADGEIYVMTTGSNSLIPGKGRIWKLIPAK